MPGRLQTDITCGAPGQHLMRNAYYCAVADIAMEVTRRASDISTSPSSLDRAAFPLVPALDIQPSSQLW